MGNGVVVARRGLSDIAIRNLFIFPTLIFLILINIFPLFYSLILSFADYSAPAHPIIDWIGIKNYSELLNDPTIARGARIDGIQPVTGQVSPARPFQP